MFVLLAGPQSAADDQVIDDMARGLAGADASRRFWCDHDRNAAAVSLLPHFLPEDRFDVQPLFDGEVLFVCQARLDNRDEVISQLGIDSSTDDLADSALLFKAYGRWGIECLQKLTGDYAFAAWHRLDGRVIAAVDPLGTRRLFWTRSRLGIALTPQLGALLAHPEVSSEPDLHALARLLDMGIDRTSTPFRKIAALPGGHVLEWKEGDPTLKRWWNPNTRAAVWYRDAEEYVDEARELFTRAVRAQLRSTSAISTTLSGGLDSGAVTAMAARLLSGHTARVTSYTAVPEAGLIPSARRGWETDDREYAREVAASFPNIDHQLVSPAGRCTLDVVSALHESARTPSKSSTNLLWLDAISRRVAASGSRVLLLGQHGNAAFSWRGQATVWELAVHGHVRAAYEQIAIEGGTGPMRLARVLAAASRDALRTFSSRKIGDRAPSRGLQYLQKSQRPRADQRLNEYAIPTGSRRYWATFATTPRHVWWPEPVQEWGIEWRDPTADRRVVERLLQYPQAAFRAGGRRRGLAREIAKGLLPDRVRMRSTQGAQVPEAPSLIAAHAQRYEEALGVIQSSSACRDLLDLPALRRSLELFVRGSRDYGLALVFDRAFDIGLFLARFDR
jgi:asparagine synthase (glutamine-hydrolysing)